MLPHVIISTDHVIFWWRTTGSVKPEPAKHDLRFAWPLSIIVMRRRRGSSRANSGINHRRHGPRIEPKESTMTLTGFSRFGAIAGAAAIASTIHIAGATHPAAAGPQ